MSSQRSEKVKQILLEMFNQRNYHDIKIDNHITAIKPNGEQIYGFTKIIEKLNNDEIHAHIALIQEDNIKHCILVYEGVPTPAVKSVISNLPNIGINIELFHADDLQFNITKHELVPKHEILPLSEAKEFKQKYGTNIPTILKSDSVARFFDFHKGEIIRITRKSGAISYRIVR
jgi:DNA-directed RNA polymerase I, II, and III subunit RPABC1